MINRYYNRKIYKNSLPLYQQHLDDRGVKHINQYDTPKFTYPDPEIIERIDMVEHVWSTGDRFFKLASMYYGNPNDWWIIAKFNNKPTESHIKLGDIILIPTPLHEILKFMR